MLTWLQFTVNLPHNIVNFPTVFLKYQVISPLILSQLAVTSLAYKTQKLKPCFCTVSRTKLPNTFGWKDEKKIRLAGRIFPSQSSSLWLWARFFSCNDHEREKPQQEERNTSDDRNKKTTRAGGRWFLSTSHGFWNKKLQHDTRWVLFCSFGSVSLVLFLL